MTAVVSQRALDKKKRNRRQVLWTVSIATIIIMLMTWYDVAVRDYSRVHRTPDAARYIAADSNTSLLADDYTGVVIWQGELQTAVDGNAMIVGGGATPQPFPQRQVDLIIGLPHLPAASQRRAAFAAITGLAEQWEKHNNMVSDLILDIRGIQASAKDMQSFIKDMRDEQKLSYRVGLLIDPLSDSGPVMGESKDARFDLLSSLSGLFYYLPTKEAAASIVAADNIEFPYNIILRHPDDQSAIPADSLGQYKYFRQFIVGVPATAPDKEPHTP